jgi:hypothetical protein
MQCSGRMSVTENGKRFTGRCENTPRVFYIAKLANRFDDGHIESKVFGFCEKCAEGKDNPSEYKPDKCWVPEHILKEIVSVEMKEETEALAFHKECRMNEVKNMLLELIMENSKNEDLANCWQEVFKMALDEFQIRTVMGK